MWWVAVQDLCHARIEGHRLPLWAGGQVGGRQRVRDGAVFERELIEVMGQTAFAGLESSAAVVRHEGGQSQWIATAQETPGAVNGVHPGLDQIGCVAEIVQPCCGDEQAAVREVHGDHELPGSLGDGLHVSPSIG